jgi:YegS/Rv2252/BmrU family lipid kinase
MPPSRIVVVINPRAQNGALGRRWPELAGVLRRELGGFEEAITTAPGDATRLSRQAVDAGADTVVAVGGDGTISEVAAGFFDGPAPRTDRAALGVLPFGTGGDFRRTIGVPRDVAAAARIIARRALRPIDVGHLRHARRAADGGGEGERVFVNIASFGMSALVDELANASSKRLGGKVSFLLASARAGLRYQNRRVRLTFDGDAAGALDLTINTVAVANGRYFGGGMFVAPHAELDDGAFDVVAMGDFGKADLLLSGHRMYRGTHLSMDKVSSRRAREVRAEALDGEVALDVDGETPGVLPATFRVLPRALSLIGAA